MQNGPVAFCGESKGRTTSWPSRSTNVSARFSATVLPVTGQGVAVEQAAVEEHLHDERHAPDAVEVLHHVAAGGLHVGEGRGRVVEVVELARLERNLGFVRQGDEVEDRVGRPAERHHRADRVLESLPRHDVAGPDAALEHREQSASGGAHVFGLGVLYRWYRRRAGQAHAEGFRGRGHRVRGVHAAARARARTGFAFDGVQLLVAHPARRVGPDRLEDADDVELATLVAAGLDRAAVAEDRRDVEPSHRHDRAGHGLVAAADRQQGVHAVPADDELDGVGDDVAAGQRGLHAFGAHGLAVGDEESVELHRLGGARGDELGFGEGRELVVVDVARRDLGARARDADDRQPEVVVAKADRPEHGAVGSALGPCGHFGRGGVERAAAAAGGGRRGGGGRHEPALAHPR